MEALIKFLSTDTARLILPALIGAITAITVIIIKDIVLYELRERKRERSDLIDRKLSKLYNPLYVFCVSGQRTLSTAIGDERCFEMIIENQHLFSKELQEIFDQYLGLTSGEFSNMTIKLSEGQKGLELTQKFTDQLKKEMDSLRKEFQ